MIESELQAWLDRYADAFVREDADAAARLFSADETYQWGPFGELLYGPEEIRAKWAAATGSGGRPTCEFEILGITDDYGFARWIASYTYPAEGRRTRYDGVFLVRLATSEHCSEFREWWNSLEETL